MDKKQEYTSNDIRVLDEITHLRLNPEMYIGSTFDSTHLVEEVFDNSLDEALAGHAKIIAVNIDTKNKICTIIDNGRGIPIDDDVPIKISTKLFSGSKFKDNKNAYAVSSGLHGIGLVAVNILSEFYNIEIYRDNKKALFNFKNGKLVNKVIENTNEKAPFSTKIQFKADAKIFENVLPNINRIKNRLLSSSVELQDCIFVLNVDDKRDVIKLTPEQHFTQHCLNESDKQLSNLILINSFNKVEKFSVKFCYSLNGSPTPKVTSSVNILPVEDGGTHINIFYDILKTIFINKAKKFNKIFQPNDCLCGLRSYISLSLIDAKFGGQTKGKLENKKAYFDVLAKKLYDDIDAYFNKNQDQLLTLLNHFEAYRKSLKSKQLKTGTEGKRGSTQFTKLRDCNLRGGELFIVEGDSAGGCFSGETNILLSNGDKIRIDEIHNAIKNNNEEFNVLSFNEDLELVNSKVENSSLTKYVDEIIEITFDNGVIIKCTPDHPFRLKNGEWIEAQYITCDTELLSVED